MKAFYSYLRLLGYKINELSNGDIRVQRTDGIQAFFNADGNLIMGNFDESTQISKEVYAGLRDNQVILFNRQGNIIDEAESKDNWEDLYTLDINVHHICLFYFINGCKITHIYSTEGTLKFKVNSWDVIDSSYQIVCNDGIRKLVYCEKKDKNTKVIIEHTNGKKENLDIGQHTVIGINNNFISTIETGNSISNRDVLLDFKGQIIFKADRISIDTINLDNDTVLMRHRNTIRIYSKLNNIDIEHKVEGELTGIEFTTNKDIIKIDTTSGSYLLNIRTLQRTSSNFDAGNVIGNIVSSKTLNDKRSICKLDLNTFELTEVKQCNYSSYTNENIILFQGHDEEYYTRDLIQLIHEFD